MELGQVLLDDPGVDLLLIQEHAPDPKRGRSGAALKARSPEPRASPCWCLAKPLIRATAYTEQFVAEAGVPFMHGIDRGLKARRVT